MERERENSMERTLLKAVVAHCDGKATDAEQQILAEMIKSDPKLRRQFVLHLQIHSAFKFGSVKFFGNGTFAHDETSFPLPGFPFCTGSDGAGPNHTGPNENSPLDFGNLNPLDGIAQCKSYSSPEKTMETSSPLFSFFTFFAQPIPMAITMFCVLIIPMAILVWTISKSQPDAPPACVASGQVLKTVACTWDESQGIGLRTGDLLINHREYHLKEGIVQLDFASGVKTIIQGPAVFRSKSSMLLELTQGRLSAVVPPEGKNFTVTMPGLKVVDHGTEFGVSVDESAEVEIHVFKGRIDVLADSWKQNGEAANPLELRAGQASCIDRLTGKVEKMAADESKFVREFNTESGLNLTLINPSFEEPCVADHPERLKETGNLRSMNGLPGWIAIKSSNEIGSYPVYVQQAPYLTDPTGKLNKVQQCIQKSIDGKQMLGMRLGGINEVWVFQPIGTIRMGDVGKTIRVSANVVAREATNANATAYGSTATAVLAFTVNTTEESQGKVIGYPGVAAGVSLNQSSKYLTAELTIKPHMIGKNLAVRLLLHDPDPQCGKLKDDYDPVNQYYFDAVDLKLRHQETFENTARKTDAF